MLDLVFYSRWDKMTSTWSEQLFGDALWLIPAEAVRPGMAEVRRQLRLNERQQRQRLFTNLARWEQGEPVRIPGTQ